jgi:HSP20 family protein
MLPTMTRRSFRPFYLPTLFDNDFFPSFSNTVNTMPAVNIAEDEKYYNLELAIPGIDKKDLKIDINADVLTISSENSKESEDSKDGYKRKEFSYSSFSKSFYIPENVNRDKIEASYKDGVLLIGLPKNEEGKNNITRKIDIL